MCVRYLYPSLDLSCCICISLIFVLIPCIYIWHVSLYWYEYTYLLFMFKCVVGVVHCWDPLIYLLLFWLCCLPSKSCICKCDCQLGNQLDNPNIFAKHCSSISLSQLWRSLSKSLNFFIDSYVLARIKDPTINDETDMPESFLYTTFQLDPPRVKPFTKLTLEFNNKAIGRFSGYYSIRLGLTN